MIDLRHGYIISILRKLFNYTINTNYINNYARIDIRWFAWFYRICTQMAASDP